MPSVLLVDDDPHLLSSLRRSLRAQPYDLFTASCGELAKEMIRQSEFDLVVVDQKMQHLPGVKLVSWIAENYPTTIRIMLSGQNEPSVLLAAINEGQVFRFLVKPCPVARIATTIRDGLDQRLSGNNVHISSTDPADEQPPQPADLFAPNRRVK